MSSNNIFEPGSYIFYSLEIQDNITPQETSCPKKNINVTGNLLLII